MQVNTFLATNVLPLLRRILLDPDKILSLCTNIVYYIVNPTMKSSKRCVYPECALSAIKADVGERWT